MNNKKSNKFIPWLQAILGVVGIMSILVLILSIVGNFISNNQITSDKSMNEFYSNFIFGILQNVIIIFCSIFIFCCILKKPFSQLGLKTKGSWKRDFIAGLILGTATMGLVFLLMVVTGNVKIIKFTSIFNKEIIASFICFILVGFGEEIMSRGFIMGCLRSTKNKWVLLITPSIIFGLLHIGNSGISYIAMANLILFGLCVSYSFYVSGNIWLPIGFHIMWNFCEGSVFGFLVSGFFSNSIISTKISEENIFNGGRFGPEGGLIVTGILIILFILIRVYYRNSEYDFFKD